MSDRLNLGAKRLKIFHRASASSELEGSGPSANQVSSVPPLGANVTEEIQGSQPTPALDPPTESVNPQIAWVKLGKLARLLNENVQVFEPLKSAVDMITKGIKLLESESRGREEYRILHVELESLFEDLTGYFARSSRPAMANVITKVTKSIEEEIKAVTDKQGCKKSSRLLETARDEDEVLRCYRRVQSLLRRLTLNVDINILDIVDEQTMDMRIAKLPNSSAATYMSAQSEIMGRGGCTPNTRSEILQQMHDWAYDAQGHRIYWLNGMAGTGKTTIAYSICSNLDRTRKLAASFFCSRLLPECRDVNRIIPSIAYQLSLFSRSFRRALSDILLENPEAYNRPLATQFEQLILKPLEEVAAHFPMDRVVVIDALDECEDKSSVDRLLNALLENARTHPVKFFVTSRPEAKIVDRMRRIESEHMRTELRLHELERTTVQDDIRTYLSFELSCMNLSGTQIEVLIERSGVLFIYAATVVRYVGSDNFSSSVDRLRDVLSISVSSSTDVNREIDGLYATILRAAFDDPSSSPMDKMRMELLLRTIVCAQEPLTLGAIASLTKLDADKAVRPRMRPLMSLLHLSDGTGVLTTLHESFPDFLRNTNRSREFYCDSGLHHDQMARMCFNVIDEPDPPFNICLFESSYVSDKDVPQLDENIDKLVSGALHYACRYWGVHIAQAHTSQVLVSCLESFVFTRLLLWLEVLNLKKCMSDGARTLCSGIQMVKCSREGKELMQDALEFITVISQGHALQSTPHIYLSGLTFWSKDWPIWKHYSQYLVGLISAKGTTIDKRRSMLIVQIKTNAKPTNCVAYSPHGAHVVSGHPDGTVNVWDAHTSQRVGQPLEGHAHGVSCVSYSPDGVFILSGSLDGSIRMWYAGAGQRIAQFLEGHTDRITSIQYSPDGSRIVSASYDETVRIWDAQMCLQIGQPLKGHTDSVNSVAYSPDGACIASGSDDMTVRIWSVKTGLQIGQPLVGHTDVVRTVAYSPDGSRLISGSCDETIRVWNPCTGQLMGQPLQAEYGIFTVAYSPDGTSIVAGSEYGDIRVWDAHTDKQVKLLYGSNSATPPVLSVAYSPDSTRIASCFEGESSISIWSGQSSHEGITLHRKSYCSVNAVVYSPEGDRIISSGHRDNTICIWNAQTAQSIGAQPFGGQDASIHSVACSPDGAYIIFGSDDNTIRMWDAGTAQQIDRPFQGHTGPVRSVVYSPDGIHIASGSHDKTIRIWCANTGQPASQPLAGQSGFVCSIAYSPDGSRIVSGTGDNVVHIWDVQTGKQIGEPLLGHTGPVASVAYSPDCTCIISGSWDNTICVWDAINRKQIGLSLKGHAGTVNAVAYTPDGTLIVSGSSDGTVRIWDACGGQPIGNPFVGHTNSVTSVAVSPCGRQVASGSHDGVIRIWAMPTNQAEITLAPLPHHIPRQTPDILEEISQPVRLIPAHRGLFNFCDAWTLREDGWVVIDGHKLLVWVPLDLHTLLLRPRNHLLISEQGWLQLDLSSAKLGEHWRECYQVRAAC